MWCFQRHTRSLYVNVWYNRACEPFWDWKCQSQALSEHFTGGHMEIAASCYKTTEKHFLFCTSFQEQMIIDFMNLSVKKNSRDGLDEMQCSLYVIYYVQVWANRWDSKSQAPNINLFQCLCINECFFIAEASLLSCLFSLGKENTWTGCGRSRFSPSHSDKAQQIAPMTGISQVKNGFWDKRLGWDQLGCPTALRHGQVY